MKSLLSWVVLLWAPAALLADISTSIVNSPHNLSASGPGTVRAVSEQEICIFCHTPHNSAPIQPLWNRETPPTAYRMYQSQTFKGKYDTGKPEGSSKLCLSCHDGTIALGSVLSRNQPIQMSGNMTVIPPDRKTNLGTDLSDDHPISFTYNAALAAEKSPKLRDPGMLPPGVKLDSKQQLQCTSCHEPHDNSKGKFLVMDNTTSQLCKSCHIQGTTTITNHVQCASCHQPHTAPSGPYLLKAAKVSETCTACHSGGIGPNQGSDIAADLNKTYKHDTYPVVNLPTHVPNIADCTDCHEPHTMKSGTAIAPAISPRMGQVSGINELAAPVTAAQYEYEVCFKCHADSTSVPAYISRQIVQNNTRLEFGASAVSYHPVERPGANSDVPSLKPGLSRSTIIKCSDCHGSDTSKKAGGTGPDGVHGSTIRPLLLAPYATDYGAESEQTYGLCYRCHDRANLLADTTFKEHKRHIVDVRASCSMCHDAHGISSTQGNVTNNSKLINFDTRFVLPIQTATGPKLQYQNLGMRRGACYLTCHDKAHDGLGYGDAGVMMKKGIRKAPSRRK